MPTIKFNDYNYDRCLVLQLAEKKNGDSLPVNMWLLDKNRAILCEKNADIQPAKLYELTDWIENLSKDSIPFELTELNMNFEWGHFEKGELYFRLYVHCDNEKYILLDWYQGETNARRVAAQMRDELSSIV